MRFITVVTDYIRKSLVTTQGDLITRGNQGVERLPAGTSGHALITKGVSTVPVWERPSMLQTVQADNIRFNKIDIGPWNMDANDTLNVVTTWLGTEVLFAMAYIINDTGSSVRYPIDQLNSSTGINAGGVFQIQDNLITLKRTDGSLFDNTGYDDAVMNRGFLIVITAE